FANPWYAGRYVGSSLSACWYALRAWSRFSLASTGDGLASASPAAMLPQTTQIFGDGSFLGRSLSFLILSGSMWAVCGGVGAGAGVDEVVFVPVEVQPAMPPSRASDQNIRLRQSIVVPLSVVRGPPFTFRAASAKRKRRLTTSLLEFADEAPGGFGDEV